MMRVWTAGKCLVTGASHKNRETKFLLYFGICQLHISVVLRYQLQEM